MLGIHTGVSAGVNIEVNTAPNGIYPSKFQPATRTAPKGAVSFCADRFEKNGNKIRVYNPYTMSFFSGNVSFNPKKEQDIMLESKTILGKKQGMFLHYDPKMRDFLKDNKTGELVDTVILKSVNPDNNNQLTYHFMSEDLTKEYGFVCLSKHVGKKLSPVPLTCDVQKFFRRFRSSFPNTEPLQRQDITRDFKSANIEGDRVEIEYVQNLLKNRISGVGNLAGKMAVAYCYENQIEPNIVFYSMNNSHIENYMRGSRFLPLENESKTAKEFRLKYGTDNPNIVMENLLKSAKAKKSATKSWGDMGMYIPKNVVEDYSKQYSSVSIKIENPFKSHEYFSCDLHLDMTQPRTFVMKNDTNLELTVEYDPKLKGHLRDRETDEPVETYILKVHDDDNPLEDAFVFMSTDLSNEYGFVELDREYDRYSYELERDYPEQGIRGDRVVVAYLQNKDKCKIGGVGKLADRVAVKYCKEHNINPRCIISHAAEGSHVAHYSRGKRFIPPKKKDSDYKSLKNNYGETNPNKILKRLIAEAQRDDSPVNVKGWGELDLVMFLPKELVDKYSREGIV